MIWQRQRSSSRAECQSEGHPSRQWHLGLPPEERDRERALLDLAMGKFNSGTENPVGQGLHVYSVIMCWALLTSTVYGFDATTLQGAYGADPILTPNAHGRDTLRAIRPQADAGGYLPLSLLAHDQVMRVAAVGLVDISATPISGTGQTMMQTVLDARPDFTPPQSLLDLFHSVDEARCLVSQLTSGLVPRDHPLRLTVIRRLLAVLTGRVHPTHPYLPPTPVYLERVQQIPIVDYVPPPLPSCRTTVHADTHTEGDEVPAFPVEETLPAPSSTNLCPTLDESRPVSTPIHFGVGVGVVAREGEERERDVVQSAIEIRPSSTAHPGSQPYVGGASLNVERQGVVTAPASQAYSQSPRGGVAQRPENDTASAGPPPLRPLRALILDTSRGYVRTHTHLMLERLDRERQERKER
ncbi:hypothetical protein KIPB_003189 [Kipferlia bialata]|uniref:Uncharacterized protein n=1 Tax=Kipferlia bialata TaxID=797122 RepID=A0A9K3GH96_9EUKA|nr:hypothetical protein KIPB_003189 [Kipferlia bialata]|eukprot:g3189.t1